MTKKNVLILAFSLLTALWSCQLCEGKEKGKHTEATPFGLPLTDTMPTAEIMVLIKTVINSTDSFNIDAVANVYTPNAVVADDEPPYSWNGPTAGVQWVNAVEKSCKDNRLTRLKGSIGSINVFQQSAENAYIVVPVNYTGILPGRQTFTAEGAFTFVLRLINGKWMIKSQVWMPSKGL